MKYYIVAGEASGDLHGSNLMKGLYAEDPQAQLRFWGGPLMDAVYHAHEAGDGLVEDYREGAVMGVVEVIRKGPQLLRRFDRCKADITAWKPDVVILIDYPGFNLKVAEFAHKAGIKVFYYIAPKVWATREGRVKKLRAWVDKLFIVFPFEKPYFDRQGLPYVYAGNPLIDAIASHPALQESREDFLARTGLPNERLIALLAGSRSMEIGQMMPVYMSLADAWHAAHPDDVFVVAAAPARTMKDYQKYVGAREWVKVVFGETYAVLKNARAAVINSGTASLEAALIGTPQVVGYRMNPITGFIARRLIRVKYISLGNLILDRLAFKEYFQEYFTEANLREELERLAGDDQYRSAMLSSYGEIRAALGGSGASAAVARAMIEELK
jgi:lipid-A-disaccharide synthase